MPAFTVHAPETADAREDTDKFVFLRDGFHFWAMVFGPLWLLWHRLWLVLFGYLAVSGVLAIALSLLRPEAGTRTLVLLMLAILMGLEAASLRRWSYSRGRWRQIDFVVADDEETAERRFFDRWTQHRDSEPAPAWRVPAATGQPRAAETAPEGIIGLFPEPGGPR